MEGLTTLEDAVLAKLLAGEHPLLAALRLQAERGHLASRDYTGAGFYCSLAMPPDVLPITSSPNFHFGDVIAKIPGLRHGAGFVILVRGGRLDTLEGYSYDEPWPEEVGDFELSYGHEPRRLQI